MFRKLVAVELLKIRRSLALLMMFVIPLVVVLLNFAMLVKRHDIAQIDARQWFFYWTGITGSWSYFMMPLYMALITGLLNGQEHKNQTWRLMLTLPLLQLQLFVVKGILAWLFVVGSTLVLLGATLLTVGGLLLAGAPMDGALSIELLTILGKVALTCIPVLVFQHAISWRFQNLVLPLAVGVVATMGAQQIGSSTYWVWYPWSYPIMAMLGSDPAKQQHAMMLAAVVGAALLAVSAILLGRREVEN
ncbi:ABC transporter permease [Massilia sp. TSP1-1-2]|uniref:ABC transporter permease n=1 Tax=unclassified Massilia TaxID=2609279 RepID=UPI003CF01E2D